MKWNFAFLQFAKKFWAQILKMEMAQNEAQVLQQLISKKLNLN